MIEILVVMAIIAILTAVALPSYQSSIRKSRRSDAFIALSNTQLAQEKWRANNTTYGTLPNLGLPSTTEKGYYNIAAADITATGYTLTARAPAGSSQTADTECLPLTVTVSNALSPTYYGTVVAGQSGMYYGPSQTCWVK